MPYTQKYNSLLVTNDHVYKEPSFAKEVVKKHPKKKGMERISHRNCSHNFNLVYKITSIRRQLYLSFKATHQIFHSTMSWKKAALLLCFSIPLLVQSVEDFEENPAPGENQLPKEIRVPNVDEIQRPEFDPDFDCYTDCKNLWCECIRPCFLQGNGTENCFVDCRNETLYPKFDQCIAFCADDSREGFEDYDYYYEGFTRNEFGDYEGDEFDPDQFFGECEDAPSSAPTFTAPPTTSLSPTASPTISQAPSTSSAPTSSCACPDCVHDSGCNNDPHYRTWNQKYYDYQGSCDQVAIDNNVLQLQIRTRPRGYYTTVTQVAFEMKAYPGLFRATDDSLASLVIYDTLSTATAPVDVTSSNVGSYNEQYKISFTSDPGSFILIRKSFTGMNIDVRGKGAFFCGSEGMFGSWDDGGAKYSNGTDFVFTGNYYTDKANAVELAQSWQVTNSISLLDPPSDICDGEADCGDDPGQLSCDSIDRKLAQGRKLDEEAYSNCTQSCDDIAGPDFLVGFCERDIEITNDTSWACDPAYVDPQVGEVTACEFRTRDDAMCSKKGDTCQRLGGFCKLDCEDDDSHVCLPGICSIDRGYKETMVRRLTRGKGGWKKHKPSKSHKKSKKKSPNRPKSPKHPKPSRKKCMCYAPVDCAGAP